MARPVLPRFEVTVFKPTAAGQEPAEATVDFYVRGATVADGDALPPLQQNYPVSVIDAGDLQPGDLVRVGAGPDMVMVSSIFSSTQVVLSNPNPTLVTLPAGARLFVSNRTPAIHTDPLGNAPAVSFLQTDAASGQASAFSKANRFDYEVYTPGQPTRTYLDAAGRMGRSNQRWNDLRDFGGGLERAIAALPDTGGVVFVPRGEWLLPNPVTILKYGVTIMGEGHGSILRPGPGMTADLITIDSGHCRLRDLTIDGAASDYDSAGPCCVVVRGLGLSGTLSIGHSFEHVKFTRAARHGLWLRDVIASRIHYCDFEGNLGNGVSAETPAVPNAGGSTTLTFVGCRFIDNGVLDEPDGAEPTGRGMLAKDVVSLTLQGCSFEGNSGGFYPAGDNDYRGNAIEVDSCLNMQVLSCTFRAPRVSVTPGHFVALGSSHGSLVDGCYFDGGPDTSTTKPPKGGVVFNNTVLSRVSSCVGYRLLSQLAWFDGTSRDGVEFANSEVEQATAEMPARIRAIDRGLRLASMSRHSLSSPDVLAATDLPEAPNVDPGALLWRGSTDQFVVWDVGQLRPIGLQP